MFVKGKKLWKTWKTSGETVEKGVVPVENLMNLSDEKLVELSVENEHNATEILVERYKYMVKKRAHTYFIIGADNDDIIQEGMIGLFKAIKCYDSNKDSSFKTFADMCIRRQIMTAVKASTRQKHIPLNSSVSFDRQVFEEDSDKEAYDIMEVDNGQNPEEIFIKEEELQYMRDKIELLLSSFERRVLKLYLSGRSYQEIGRLLGKSEKSIDNALQRLKRKLDDS